jgi:hypothetical protein
VWKSNAEVNPKVSRFDGVATHAICQLEQMEQTVETIVKEIDYVENDPSNLADPSGLSPRACHQIAIGEKDRAVQIDSCGKTRKGPASAGP